jgi:hypothetical protein
VVYAVAQSTTLRGVLCPRGTATASGLGYLYCGYVAVMMYVPERPVKDSAMVSLSTPTAQRGVYL